MRGRKLVLLFTLCLDSTLILSLFKDLLAQQYMTMNWETNTWGLNVFILISYITEMNSHSGIKMGERVQFRESPLFWSKNF